MLHKDYLQALKVILKFESHILYCWFLDFNELDNIILGKETNSTKSNILDQM